MVCYFSSQAPRCRSDLRTRRSLLLRCALLVALTLVGTRHHEGFAGSEDMHCCLWSTKGHDLDELVRQVTRRVVVFEQEPVAEGTSSIGVVERHCDARA